MIALALVLALVQAPAPAAPPAPELPVAAPAPEDTLAGLQQIYATTCGQTGILYHSYDELCEGIRKQIAAYERKMAKAAAKPAKP